MLAKAQAKASSWMILILVAVLIGARSIHATNPVSSPEQTLQDRPPVNLDRLDRWQQDHKKLPVTAAHLKGPQRRLIITKAWPSPLVRSMGKDWSAESSMACRDTVHTSSYSKYPREPIQSVDALAGQRTLVFFARFGVGNTLRGYQSAFIYSILSGRRIVLFRGYHHRKVITLLCWAFNCGPDIISDPMPQGYPGSPTSEFFRLYNGSELSSSLSPQKFQSTLFSADPVVWVYTGAHFDDYWRNNTTLSTCVLHMLGCRDLWCVRSVAMNYFTRYGPTEAMGATVEDSFVGVDSKGRKYAVPAGAGLNLWFDVAIHMRMVSKSVEMSNKFCPPGKMGLLCSSEEKQKLVFRRHGFWTCVSEILRNNSNVSGPKPNIFLATDSEFLRPLFVQKLQRFGVVYHSHVSPQHSSKVANVSDGFPSMASFFLLGRSSLYLSMTKRTSSFQLAAALVGNGSLTMYVDGRSPHCGYKQLNNSVAV